MASFGEQKLLLKSDRKLIGIRPGRNVEEVILTYDNGITICDIDHKKVKRSWSIGKGQQFTAPCIYNNRDDEYVVVQEGIVIRTFNEQSFNNGQRFTVNVPIYEITADCDNHDSAVVFNNGNILTLEAVLENPSGIPSTDPLVGNILFCKLLTNLTSVMCIQEDNNSFLLFGNGYQNNEKLKIQFQYRACELRSVCVHCSSPQVIKVFSLWSDGSVCETSISFPDNVGLPVEFVNIKEFQNKSISENNMVSLSSDCIALVAQESGDYREVSVIDTKFGMCHHTISSLPLSTKIYTTAHNLYVVDQHSVSVVQLTTHPVTLSSVIRKQAAPVTTPLEAIYWGADENKVCNEESESMESTEALLRCTNERQATKYWEEMWLAKSDSQRHRLCCSTFMKELFTNLTDSKLPWMPHLLEKILKSGHISSSVCPNLIRVILEHKEWKLLRTCVKLLRDISESDVVLCLDSLLGDNLMGDLPEDIIVDILALPYTEDLLKNEVRKLPFLKSVQLLKFLRTKLNLSSSLSDCLPDYDQVASWIGLLLDAHSTSIITTPHVWPLLTELQSTILLQTELFSELQKIDVLLNQINQPCNFNKNSNIFEYSVHRMVL